MDAGIKIGINVGFGELNKAGIKATRTVAGSNYVESGANKVSKSIIQGTKMSGGKITEKTIEEIKK